MCGADAEAEDGVWGMGLLWPRHAAVWLVDPVPVEAERQGKWLCQTTLDQLLAVDPHHSLITAIDNTSTG